MAEVDYFLGETSGIYLKGKLFTIEQDAFTVGYAIDIQVLGRRTLLWKAK